MKFYHKFNQYLLENYPTIWNTKIVWMVLASLIVHFLFFIIGFLSHIDPVSLQSSNAISDYFTDGIILIHLIISLLLLVIWLVMMFKNNAFKNFYPNSKAKLFFQFFQYFIIIFLSISFYYSYMIGFKLFINLKYDDESMNQKIEVINKTAPFLSQKLENYTLEQRKFPEEFSKLFCEQDDRKIEANQKYFTFLDRNYQFFNTYSKTIYKKDSLGRFLYPEPEKTNGAKLAYKDARINSVTYYFKKEVVDLSSQITTANPSYYNYSSIFYFKDDKNNYSGDFSYDMDYNNQDPVLDSLLVKEKFRINKSTAELLNRNDALEIQKQLSEFLKITNDFSVKTNLDVKSWFKIVYQPKNYELVHFIREYEEKDKYDYDDYDYTEASVDSAAIDEDLDYKSTKPLATTTLKNIEKPGDFFKERLTNYYFYEKDLATILRNIDEIKSSDVIAQSIHIIFWVSFILASLVFCYRVTNLRSLLFSIVTTGVLTLLIILITIVFRFSSEKNSNNTEFLALYLIWGIGTTILLNSIFALNKIKKNILGIFINIVIGGFIFYVLLYFGIIAAHQDSICREHLTKGSCTDIFDDLGSVTVSYICLIASFVFLYFYSGIIQKWKALPS